MQFATLLLAASHLGLASGLHHACRPPHAARTRRPLASLADPSSLATEASLLADRLRTHIESAEDELRVEVEHCKKFMWRGDGLRHDFAHAQPSRRRALLRGVAANEQALLQAMSEAESAGLPREYMEDAIRCAASLAVVKAEIEHDYLKLADAEATTS